MQGHAAQPNLWISYAVTAVVIGVVFLIRWRRMRRVRPLRIEQLWIFPALYAALAAYMMWRYPPTGWGWAFCALALVLGGAFGWQRGKLMRIRVDPETHEINQHASPWAVLFILLLIVVRTGARTMMATDNPFHLNAMAITDMLIAFALGMFTMQRIEMYLRARRLLEEARAG